MDALIGATGFVGGTLLRQRLFDREFSSKNIRDFRDGAYDLVVCAGAPAAKWIADANPDTDLANIKELADNLSSSTAKDFVLISTVDVFADSRGQDEDSVVDEANLTPYGRNRFWLECFVRERFPEALIVRLPGLVGPGLRKNAIFDFLNGNNIQLLNALAKFQFYPMVNLWTDLQAALSANLRTLHLTSAPVSLGEVAKAAFGLDFDNRIEGRAPASYDLQTVHAQALGGEGRHTYSARESLTAIRAYAQSEPRSKPIA